MHGQGDGKQDFGKEGGLSQYTIHPHSQAVNQTQSGGKLGGFFSAGGRLEGPVPDQSDL